MTAEHLFCESCGAPLSAGARFCEDCGASVTEAAPESSPASPTDRPCAVVPFAYTRAGLFSVANCTLVVYPEQVVVAYVPESRAEEWDRATTEVEAALFKMQVDGKSFWDLVAGAGVGLVRLSWSAPDFFTADAARERDLLRTIGISVRPWEAYWTMPSGAALAEDPRNRAIARDTIAYVRGESDLSANTHQVLFRSSDGLLALFFELGTFAAARKALFSFLMPATGVPEQGLGVIPLGERAAGGGVRVPVRMELIMTDRRLVFCMCEDEFVDETVEWLPAREKEAKTAGRDWRDLDEIGRPDSPWQRLAGTPISGLLANDVNFFISLRAVGAVEVVPGARRHGDEVRFTLPGEVVTLSFPQGTAELARAVLERALPGRVR